MQLCNEPITYKYGVKDKMNLCSDFLGIANIDGMTWAEYDDYEESVEQTNTEYGEIMKLHTNDDDSSDEEREDGEGNELDSEETRDDLAQGISSDDMDPNSRGHDVHKSLRNYLSMDNKGHCGVSSDLQAKKGLYTNMLMCPIQLGYEVTTMVIDDDGNKTYISHTYLSEVFFQGGLRRVLKTLAPSAP